MADLGGSGGGAGGGVAADLMQRLERRDATVGVVGLGYVGLPLAVAFAKAGMRVIGVDADVGRVERIGRGQSPIEDVPSDELTPLVRTGRLTVAAGVRALGPADLASSDLVAALTAHREFDPARLCREARLVLDTRNLTGPLGAQPHVIRL